MRAAALLAVLLLAAPALAGPRTSGLICDGDVCNFEATVSNGPANEVTIAVHPKDPRHIVAVGKDYTLGPSSACGVTRVWVGYYTSFDGGASWTNGLLPGYPGGPAGPLTGYGCVSDPTVAIGLDGTVYVGALPIAGPGGKRGVITFASLDGGRTFPLHGWSIEDSSSYVDKNWLAVDPVSGAVVVAWKNIAGTTGIHANRAFGGRALSLTGQLAFSLPVCLSCSANLDGQGAFIAFGPDGSTYVSWLAGNQLVLARSADLGRTWERAQGLFSLQGIRIGHVFRTPTLPQLAADRTTPLGTLHLTWQDGRDGNADVYLAASGDRGATWSAPVRVNQAGLAARQFFPSVCAGPDGGVRVAWIDARDDPGNFLLGVWGAVSRDGGATWAEQRLTTALSDPRLSKHQSGAVFFGDYIGTACAEDGTAYTVWTDTRKGVADAFVGHWE